MKGVKVQVVDPDRSSLTLEDGSYIQADLVIAADGARVSIYTPASYEGKTDVSIQSAVRNQVHKRDDVIPTPSTGHSAIRFMLSKAKVQADPSLSTALSDEFRMVTWMNHDKRILVYPVDFDRQLNITCTYPTSLLDAASESSESEAAVGKQTLHLSVSHDLTRCSIQRESEPGAGVVYIRGVRATCSPALQVG